MQISQLEVELYKLMMMLRLGPAATKCNEVLVVVKLSHSEVSELKLSEI